MKLGEGFVRYHFYRKFPAHWANNDNLNARVSAFDELLDRDLDFARRVLELESRQLQRFMRSLQAI
jgi:hypothetical protein